MTPKTTTRALGAVAVALVAILAAAVLHRPPPATETATRPVTSATAEPSPSSGPASPTVGDPGGEGGPSYLPTSEVDDHGDARPGATPYSQTDQARQQWQPVATGFGKAFTATQSKSTSEWRTALTPYVTGKVREQLATVDLQNVPDGTFTSIEPAEYGDDKVAVFIHYDTGLTLVTYLILDGTTWRIYAYDRWED